MISVLDNLCEYEDLNNDSCKEVNSDKAADDTERPCNDGTDNGNPNRDKGSERDKRTYENTRNKVNDYTDDEICSVIGVFPREGEKFFECTHCVFLLM